MDTDNKAYLDQIAVKGKKPRDVKPLLTPAIIKLFAAGIVAIILFVIVIGILNGNNAKTINKFQAVYLRAVNLASDEGPLQTYHEKLKSTDLRQYNNTLQSSLSTFNNSYNALTSTMGFNPEALSSEVTSAEELNSANLEAELSSGYLSGLLDHNYANSAYYQVSVLITMNEQALSASTNEQVSAVLSKFNNDLKELQKRYKSATEKL